MAYGASMRTTLNIKDDVMDALLKRTRSRTKTKAVEVAIREYLERKSIEDLIALSGNIHIEPDWEKEEEAELNGYKNHR
jgi:Arc/MetJ family transcription regulator